MTYGSLRIIKNKYSAMLYFHLDVLSQRTCLSVRMSTIQTKRNASGAKTSGRDEGERKTTLGLQTPITFDSPNPKWRLQLTARSHTSSIPLEVSEETM